jgi:hypothetical protein
MARFLTRLAIAMAGILIASVAFIGAVWFLCDAIFLAYETQMSPPLAALAAAGTLAILGIFVLLCSRVIVALHRRAQRRRDRDAVEKVLTEILTGLFGAEFASLATKNPQMTLGIALILGVALGFSPKLREAILALLRR